jgi:SAM-dependent methyltransferase
MAETDIARLATAGFLQQEYWREVWRGFRQSSFLRSSQEASPHAWRDFYDQVSDSYLELWGYNGELGRRVSRLLISQGMAGTGRRVLDVGCGPGTLSLPLAQAGSEVIALDYSPAMLARLDQDARLLGCSRLQTVCASWEDYTSPEPVDLALASFFPDAFSVSGIERLESHTRGKVALVMGSGRDAFGICRELWIRVLDDPYPHGGFHLTCALGWLMASGRRPNLSQLVWRSSITLPLETVAVFYTSYFAIFGRKGPEVEHAVRHCLEKWRQGDQVCAQGEVGLSVLWWDVRAGCH